MQTTALWRLKTSGAKYLTAATIGLLWLNKGVQCMTSKVVGAIQTLQEMQSHLKMHRFTFKESSQGWYWLLGHCTLSNHDWASLPIRAPNTKRTQPITQASIAVSPSALGMLVVIVLKMFTRTRKIVIRSVILEKSKNVHEFHKRDTFLSSYVGIFIFAQRIYFNYSILQ